MALWCSLEGLLDHGVDYWEAGDWDIIPAGIVDTGVFEFDRHDLPQMIPQEFYKARSIWLRYRDGFLMYSGGAEDQPVSHQIIVSLFNNVFAKWQKSKSKRKK